jgi:hypothetical protein
VTQPRDQNVVEGAVATFVVAAGGTGPITYQWASSPDGASYTDIAGASGSSYTIAASTANQSGMRYRVVVSNGSGSVSSSGARLNVTAAPVAPAIAVQPADVSVPAGSTATFNVHIYPVYQVEALFDQSKAHKSGSTVPIKIRVLDMNGNNVSSSSLTVSAFWTFQVDSDASYTAEDAGNANPDFNFRFEPGQQSYVYNLQTTGFETGTYWLLFRIGGTPIDYHVEFQVRR